MKRLICIALALVLASVTFNISASDFREATITYSLTEDFESSVEGGEPASGNAVEKTNKFVVVKSPDGTNQYLKYEVLTESDMFYDNDVSVSGDMCYIQFDIMYDDVGLGNGRFVLSFKDSTGATEVQILRVDKMRNLCSYDGTVIMKLSWRKFYRVCVELNLDTKTADVYVNHKKRADNIALSKTEFSGISILRTHLSNITSGEKPVIYLDNLSVYEADMPLFKYEERGVDMSPAIQSSSIADEDTVLGYMENTIALYTGQNKIAIDGEIEMLDPSDENIKVFVKDGRTFVPVRFVSEALGYDVKWSDTECIVSITDGSDIVRLTVGENTISINGTSSQMDTEAFIENNRVFVPVRAVCEAFGKKLTYDKSGLIVIADRENFFNLRDDLGIFRTISGNLVFRQPTGREMVEKLKAYYPDNAHPRIHINSVKLEEIKASIKNDENMAQWAKTITDAANAIIPRELLKYELSDGIRLLDVSGAAADRIETLSFAYLITGDEKYAKRSVEEMLNVCSFKDWNPSHFLDTAGMMCGVAIGYDWLYYYMTPEQRTMIKDAIRDLGLKQVLEDYNDVIGRKRTYKWAQSKEPDNWNLVCNGGSVIAALVIADEEEEIAAQVFDGGMSLIKNAILMYAPDGAWYEGPGYWDYATGYYTDFLSAIYSVYGDTFGYMETPGVAQTGYYINALSTVNGVFNFHDSSQAPINASALFFIADMLSDPSLAQLRLDFMYENHVKGNVRDLLWYKPLFDDADINISRDFYYRDTEVATMRSSWSGSSSIMAGIHSGKIEVYHGQMDAGQFIIDAYGTRYATDFGKDDYNIGGSKWDLYRYRAEGHNTLVINPSADGGQSLSGAPKIDRFDSGMHSAYAITDMTSVYSDYADSVKRGLKLTNNRSMIVLQDELHLKEPSEVLWFMHTQCDIEVVSDGKSARVFGDYKDMIVYLLDDIDATFSVMDASPLPTSPTNDAQNKNKGYRKLALRADAVTDITIPIGFSFVVTGDDTPDLYRPEVIKLDNWLLDSSEATEMPKLTNLTINGNQIERFDSNTLIYAYRMRDGEQIPLIAGESTDIVDVTMPAKIPGVVKITVTSAKDKNVKETYMINLTQEVLAEAPSGYRTLSIANINASSVPQAENGPDNTVDNSLDTRWSAQGSADIVYDLGSIQPLSALGIAFYQESASGGRRQYFKILISSDGINYTEVYDGESSGTTLEKELFPFETSQVRYIKIACNGTSAGSWNSITEFAAYAPEN